MDSEGCNSERNLKKIVHRRSKILSNKCFASIRVYLANLCSACVVKQEHSGFETAEGSPPAVIPKADKQVWDLPGHEFITTHNLENMPRTLLSLGLL